MPVVNRELRQRLQPHVAEHRLYVALAFHFHRQFPFGVAKLLIDIYPDGHQLAIDEAHEHISADDELDLSPLARREFASQFLGIPYCAEQLAVSTFGTEGHHAPRSSTWPSRRQRVMAELDLTYSALWAVATIAKA